MDDRRWIMDDGGKDNRQQVTDDGQQTKDDGKQVFEMKRE